MLIIIYSCFAKLNDCHTTCLSIVRSKKILANGRAALDVHNPSGSLLLTVPPETITAANRQIKVIQHAKRTGSKFKRGQYNEANVKDKATIGAYASLHGVAKAFQRMAIKREQCS